MAQRTSQLSTEPNIGSSELKSERSLSEIERKIEDVIHDPSKPYFKNALKKHVKAYPENANTVCDYIIAEITEINIKASTKETKIKVLLWFSEFHQGKSFKSMTKQDILDYLNSLRKPIGDQNQRCIGSYNCRQMILLKFFRWLYNPDEPDHTKRTTPSCMQGIRRLHQNEKTPYKHSDIWSIR